jgi:hypothetical protein
MKYTLASAIVASAVSAFEAVDTFKFARYVLENNKEYDTVQEF